MTHEPAEAGDPTETLTADVCRYLATHLPDEDVEQNTVLSWDPETNACHVDVRLDLYDWGHRNRAIEALLAFETAHSEHMSTVFSITPLDSEPGSR